MTKEMDDNERNKIEELIRDQFSNGDIEDQLYDPIANNFMIQVNSAGETGGIDRDGFEVTLIDINSIEMTESGKFRANIDMGISGDATAIEVNDDRSTYRYGDGTSFTGTIENYEFSGNVNTYEEDDETITEVEFCFPKITESSSDINIKTPPFYPEDEYDLEDEDEDEDEDDEDYDY